MFHRSKHQSFATEHPKLADELPRQRIYWFFIIGLAVMDFSFLAYTFSYIMGDNAMGFLMATGIMIAIIGAPMAAAVEIGTVIDDWDKDKKPITSLIIGVSLLVITVLVILLVTLCRLDNAAIFATSTGSAVGVATFGEAAQQTGSAAQTSSDGMVWLMAIIFITSAYLSFQKELNKNSDKRREKLIAKEKKRNGSRIEADANAELDVIAAAGVDAKRKDSEEQLAIAIEMAHAMAEETKALLKTEVSIATGDPAAWQIAFDKEQESALELEPDDPTTPEFTDSTTGKAA